MELIKGGGEIYLKALQIAEIDARVLAWFDDEALMKYYTNSKTPITKARLIDAIEQGRQQNNAFTYGIYVADNDLLIGTLKLGPINWVHQIADLVALIGDRAYLGRGLAVEAIRLGNRLAFETYHLRKLYGGMYASNLASIKAYTRAGWFVEGVLKGFYRNEQGGNEDRILVSCFNPAYFSAKDFAEIQAQEALYFQRPS